MVRGVTTFYKIDDRTAAHDVISLLEILYDNKLINIKRVAIFERIQLFIHYLLIRNFNGVIQLLKFQKRYDFPPNKRKSLQLFGYLLFIMTYAHIYWLGLFYFYFTSQHHSP